jgi:hypothetical protein
LARYHGKKGVVYMSLSGSAAATATVALRSWTLDMPTDKVEVTAFGDTNKQYTQGLPDVSGQLSGWWDDTFDGLYDASRSTDGIKLYLYPSSDAAGKYWYGPAWVDFSIDTSNDAGVSVSARFSANGAWGQV